MSTDPEVLQSALDEMPIEYRERFVQVLEGTLSDVASTRAGIDQYVAMVRKVSAWVTALDPEMADKLAAACHGLLDRFGTQHEALVVATAAYFVEEDEDDEVTGVLGFDDDIQVVNAVCRVLGANDLLVPLVR